MNICNQWTNALVICAAVLFVRGAHGLEVCEYGAVHISALSNSFEVKPKLLYSSEREITLALEVPREDACLVDSKYDLLVTEDYKDRLFSIYQVKTGLVRLTGNAELLKEIRAHWDTYQNLKPYIEYVQVEFLAKYSAPISVIRNSLLIKLKASCAPVPKVQMSCSRFAPLEFQLVPECLDVEKNRNTFLQAISLDDSFVKNEDERVSIKAVTRDQCTSPHATDSWARGAAADVIFGEMDLVRPNSLSVLSRIQIRGAVRW